MRVCLWGAKYYIQATRRGIHFHGVTRLLLDKTCVVVVSVYLFVIIQGHSNQNDGKHSKYCRITVQ